MSSSATNPYVHNNDLNQLQIKKIKKLEICIGSNQEIIHDFIQQVKEGNCVKASILRGINNAWFTIVFRK